MADGSTSDRNAALDRARTFITLLVLANHSVVAYTQFGRFYPNHYLWSTAPIVDAQKWGGFNALTLFNDAFFMSLMFFLSGLFVWPSLQRKGIGHFLRDRMLRLGIPFVAAIFVLMPLAYYASFRLTGSTAGFAAFWLDNYRSGIWFDGPAWFIWLLLLFDILAVPVFVLVPALIDAINRLSLSSRRSALLFIGALFAASAMAYIPLLFEFGAVRWFNVGPFQVQASRVLLYCVFFFAGVGVGSAGIGEGLLANAGNLALRWHVWVMTAAGAFGLLALLIDFRRMRLANLPGAPPVWWQGSYGLAYALACVTISLAVLGVFLRFAQAERNWLDPLRGNAYGIYVFHYVFCLWLQFALLDTPLSAISKAFIVFAGTLALSWSVTAMLRRIPGATRVL